jgi:hypothetical protein
MAAVPVYTGPKNEKEWDTFAWSPEVLAVRGGRAPPNKFRYRRMLHEAEVAKQKRLKEEVIPAMVERSDSDEEEKKTKKKAPEGATPSLVQGSGPTPMEDAILRFIRLPCDPDKGTLGDARVHDMMEMFASLMSEEATTQVARQVVATGLRLCSVLYHEMQPGLVVVLGIVRPGVKPDAYKSKTKWTTSAITGNDLYMIAAGMRASHSETPWYCSACRKRLTNSGPDAMRVVLHPMGRTILVGSVCAQWASCRFIFTQRLLTRTAGVL